MSRTFLLSGENYLRAAGYALAALKTRTYELMRLERGQRVLDVGCGPGVDTVALGKQVGSEGRVVGVDRDPTMVRAARDYAMREGVHSSVEHYCCEAEALPFADESFAACRSERVFQHLQAPGTALTEMIRLTRDGGWVVVADSDWATFSLDTSETDIERRLVRFAAERTCRNGYAGRQLYGLFKTNGLAQISIESFVLQITQRSVLEAAVNLHQMARAAASEGVVTHEELARLSAALDRSDRQGTVFGSINMVLAAGRVEGRRAE